MTKTRQNPDADTPEVRKAIRKVLQHHKLTQHGDGVVEADLAHATLDAVAKLPGRFAWTTERIKDLAKSIAQAAAKNTGTEPQLIFPHTYLALVDALLKPAEPAQLGTPDWHAGYKTGYETGLSDGRAEFTNPAATSPLERARPERTWIRPAERLPEPDEDGIAYVRAVTTGCPGLPQAPRALEFRHHPSLGWQPLNATGWDWIVTHWMPHPALPQEYQQPPADGIETGLMVIRKDGREMRSGAQAYAGGIVASVDPLILISEGGDMLWSATVKREDFVPIGTADEATMARVDARLASHLK